MPFLRALAARDGKVFDDRYAIENRHKVNEFLSSLKVVYAMDRKVWVLKLMIIEEPKGPIWKARDRVGERLPYYEEVEHVGGDE